MAWIKLHTLHMVKLKIASEIPKIRKLPLSIQIISYVITWMGAGWGEGKVVSLCIVECNCWAQPEQLDGSTNRWLCLCSLLAVVQQLPFISPSALPAPNCSQHPCLWQLYLHKFIELESNAVKTRQCHCLTSAVLLSTRPSKISELLVFYCCTWIEWKKYFSVVCRSAEVWFKGCQIDFRLVIMLSNVRSCSAWLLFYWSTSKYLPESEKLSFWPSFSGAEIINIRGPDLMKYFVIMKF